jgi:hypothetical protein
MGLRIQKIKAKFILDGFTNILPRRAKISELIA